MLDAGRIGGGDMALTELQTLILWALLAKPEGGSFQKDIRPEVTRKDREAPEPLARSDGEGLGLGRGQPGCQPSQALQCRQCRPPGMADPT